MGIAGLVESDGVQKSSPRQRRREEVWKKKDVCEGEAWVGVASATTVEAAGDQDQSNAGIPQRHEGHGGQGGGTLRQRARLDADLDVYDMERNGDTASTCNRACVLDDEAAAAATTAGDSSVRTVPQNGQDVRVLSPSDIEAMAQAGLPDKLVTGADCTWAPKVVIRLPRPACSPLASSICVALVPAMRAAERHAVDGSRLMARHEAGKGHKTD